MPAGGCCFLTDAAYSNKLADLWETRGERRYELDDIMLLKVGRHLRPRPHFKLIVGREEGENRFLEGYRKQFSHIIPISHKGPLVLVDGTADEDYLKIAARLAARYSQGKNESHVRVEVHIKNGDIVEMDVPPYKIDDIPLEWHL